MVYGFFKINAARKYAPEKGYAELDHNTLTLPTYFLVVTLCLY